MPRISKEEKRRRIENIAFALEREFPDAKCALHYETPEQLLFAVILSAQCTDERVNLTTPALFKKYPSSKELAKAKASELEKLIYSTGFYKNKAKSLIGAAKMLQEKYPKELPRTIAELTELPGVGRKTANVILGDIFDIQEGIVVDTHVKRLTNLLGLVHQEDPVKIERELLDMVPQKLWTKFSHWLILHGRRTCIARRPKCGECVIQSQCEFGRNNHETILREK
jgi:endonuclease-3